MVSSTLSLLSSGAGSWQTRRDPDAGLRMLEEGFARQREIATTEDFPVYLCLLAEALIVVGKAGDAGERIARERLEFDRIRLGIWIPELLLRAGRGDPGR